MNRRPAFAEGSCELHRNLSGKGVHGSVLLSFEPAPQFEFTSVANWPSVDNHNEAVRSGVYAALSSLGASTKFTCCLKGIRWHDVDSCAKGFELAAKFATYAALSDAGGANVA